MIPSPRTLILAILLPLLSSADVATRTVAKADSTAPQQPTEAEEQYFRGVRYAEGSGVPQNYCQGAKYYRAATEKGLAAAQYDLGYPYERGLGLDRDLKQAAAWYRKAALLTLDTFNSYFRRVIAMKAERPGMRNCPNSGTAGGRR